MFNNISTKMVKNGFITKTGCIATKNFKFGVVVAVWLTSLFGVASTKVQVRQKRRQPSEWKNLMENDIFGIFNTKIDNQPKNGCKN